MGREASAIVEFAGKTGLGKILLESQELILRGELRTRIARSDITGFTTEADDLVLTTPLGLLRARLGAKEAAAWVRALGRPPPSLAEKLGISTTSPARLLAPLCDPALVTALQGCIAPDAPLLIGEIEDAATLDCAEAALADTTLTAIWGVTRKGPASRLSEATLRTRLRAAGFIDTKSCTVSEIRAATRFQRR
jgi:hypothetical protein